MIEVIAERTARLLVRVHHGTWSLRNKLDNTTGDGKDGDENVTNETIDIPRGGNTANHGEGDANLYHVRENVEKDDG